MALDYDDAWRQATACIDAFNRRDMDAYEAQLHEEITHQSLFADRRLGQENSRIDGKQVHLEHLRWVWDQHPDTRHVLDEVFIGPHGYAFLAHREHDGVQTIWVREVGADGLVRSQRVYLPRQAAG